MLANSSIETSPSLVKRKVTLLECSQGSSSAFAVEWASGEGFDLTVGNNNPIQVSLLDFKVMKILVDGINAEIHSIPDVKENE